MQESFVCVLDGCITTVHWNEQYILAVEYAVKNDSVTGCYIVKILPLAIKGVPWEKIGPLSEEKHEQKKAGITSWRERYAARLFLISKLVSCFLENRLNSRIPSTFILVKGKNA